MPAAVEGPGEGHRWVRHVGVFRRPREFADRLPVFILGHIYIGGQDEVRLKMIADVVQLRRRPDPPWVFRRAAPAGEA